MVGNLQSRSEPKPVTEMSEREIRDLVASIATKVAEEVVNETVNQVVRSAVKDAAKEVMESTLLAMGLDLKEPLEIQKDMQHVRSWRVSTDTIKRQTFLSAVTVIVAGVCGLIWAAVSTTSK